MTCNSGHGIKYKHRDIPYIPGLQYRLRGTQQNSAKSTFVGCPQGVLTWDGGPMPSPLHSSMTEIIFSAQFLRSFHSISFHSILFHSISFHFIPFHFIHVNPHLTNVFYMRLNHPLTVSPGLAPPSARPGDNSNFGSAQRGGVG